MNVFIFSVLSFFATGTSVQTSSVEVPIGVHSAAISKPGKVSPSSRDTIPPPEVLDVIAIVINSTNNFDIEAVANLYTPNAVVADDEPPFSWNGPTAGIQWVNSVEKACKDNRLTKLRAKMGRINVYQQSADDAYIIVPVSYKGVLPGKTEFSAIGAFTFVLRQINGHWLIKNQAWMPQKGM